MLHSLDVRVWVIDALARKATIAFQVFSKLFYPNMRSNIRALKILLYNRPVDLRAQIQSLPVLHSLPISHHLETRILNSTMMMTIFPLSGVIRLRWKRKGLLQGQGLCTALRRAQQLGALVHQLLVLVPQWDSDIHHLHPTSAHPLLGIRGLHLAPRPGLVT